MFQEMLALSNDKSIKLMQYRNVFVGQFSHTSNEGKKFPQYYLEDSVYCASSSDDIVIQKAGKYRISVTEYRGADTNYVSVNNIKTYLTANKVVKVERELNAGDIIYVYRADASVYFDFTITVDVLDFIPDTDCPPLTLEVQSAAWSGINATHTFTFSKNVKAAAVNIHGSPSVKPYSFLDEDGNLVALGAGGYITSISGKTVVVKSQWSSSTTFDIGAITADDISGIPILIP